MLAGIAGATAAVATGADATVVTGATATVVTGTAGATATGAAGGIAIGSVIERSDGVVVRAAATSVWIVLGALIARGGRSLNDIDLAFV